MLLSRVDGAAILLLSTLAVSLISATPSFAQYKTFDLDSTYPSYSSEFGCASYAGGRVARAYFRFVRAIPT
jgi:hypothetical protein